MTNVLYDRVLRFAIPILALADGVLHFLLDFVLFRGNFFGSPFPQRPPSGTVPGTVPGRAGPPPGGGSPFILPLNELFLLNFVGAVALVVIFWFAPRWLGARRWLVDAAMIVYAAAAFIAWFIIGRPNPMGLGYLSKSIEIILIIAASIDIWSVLRPRGRVAKAT